MWLFSFVFYFFRYACLVLIAEGENIFLMIKLLHMKIIGYQNAMEGVNLRIVFAIKVYKNELRREQKKVEKTVFKTKRFHLSVRVYCDTARRTSKFGKKIGHDTRL